MRTNINKLIVAGLCLASSFCGFAQNGAYREQVARKPVSGEIYLGAGIPLATVGAQHNSLRPMAGFEIRYIFPNSHWDIGLGSKVGMISRFYMSGDAAYVSSEHYLAFDYNYRINSSLVFFAGIECGVSVAYDMSSYNNGVLHAGSWGDYYYVPKSLSPYFAARVGLEAWNRLRISVSGEICDKGNSNVSLRVGYVF